MKWFVFVFIAMIMCFTVIALNEDSSDGSVYITPTEDVSWYMVDGWEVIKESAYPNSRIVIQCEGGECTGHWELTK